MSIASRKRRRAKRGGIVGHLGRVAELLRPTLLGHDATEAERFAEMVVRRDAHVYAHPSTAPILRAVLGDIVHESAMIEHGRAMALVPSPLGLMFRPDVPIPSAIRAGRRWWNR